ncbi:MAG: cysteine--tRNA ligase [Patescibacteria group bacterium]|nr:cysteine--tRNA ligase [Patescibacteria group bacterium]
MSAPIKIKDSLSGDNKDLPKKIRLFVCGPTVYDFSHIGHARTYLAFDAFVRYLRVKHFKIFYLQNITDVDDKIIDRAKKEKIEPDNLAKKFEKEYFRDMKNLNVQSVNKYAPATKYIKEIQNQIARLIEKGYAYETKSGVYFEIKKFKDYGKLSRQQLEELRIGYRFELDHSKKDPLDFALWKFRPKTEKGWPSLWGYGRPGWHIEDTAISEKFFGLHYELHGGASELKFPHHEAEIAQARALSGEEEFVNIWMHTGLLLVNGKKMGKSLGNFITIRDFLGRHSADALRLMVLKFHYSSPFNYTEELADENEKNMDDIKMFLEKLEMIIKNKNAQSAESDISAEVKECQKKCTESLENNFNTSMAFAAISGLISAVQPKIWTLSRSNAKIIHEFIFKSFKMFGFFLEMPKIPASIQKLAAKRELYRDNKQFIQSDDLRKRVNSLGYIIEDSKIGTFIWPDQQLKNNQPSEEQS